MQQEQITEKLKQHIVVEYGAKFPELSIDLDTNLLKSGVLDSLNLFMLVVFIDDELGVSIDPDDITPENFESISAVAKIVQHYVEKK